MGGSTTTQSAPSVQTSQSGPWKQQEPYLIKGFQAAEDQFNSNKPQYFPNSTVVGFNPTQQYALNATKNTAVTSQLPGQASAELGRTMGGAYQNTPQQWMGQFENPKLGGDTNRYMSNLYDSISSEVIPGIQGNYGVSGRSGSSPIAQQAMAAGIARGIAPYADAERGRQVSAGSQQAQTAANMYDAERSRQFGGIGQAGAIEAGRYAPADALLKTGTAEQGMSQQQLQEQIDRWNFDQNKDQAKLAQYMGNISGSYGGQGIQQTTQPITSNPTMSALGTASSIASLASTAAGGK